MKSYKTILLLTIVLFSCDDTFLEIKSDKALIVPKKLKDFQALLDNDMNVMNKTIALGLMSADELTSDAAGWQTWYSATERNAFVWASDIYEGETCDDWNRSWLQVLHTNVVLDGITDIPASSARDVVEGSALFYRAYAFYNLLENFAAPYDATTAADMSGIPLRLTADVNARPARASIEDSYSQVIADLEKAQSLLPDLPEYKTRPSRWAALALLARVYLTMENYVAAEAHADQALAIYSTLLDYNALPVDEVQPIPLFNDEVIFHSFIGLWDVFFTTTTVSNELYSLYHDDDLRREIFYEDAPEGGVLMRGNYTGDYYFFSGLATDEMYLVRAECRARNGNVAGAMADLNMLLENRFAAGTFIPVTATDAVEALELVLLERRKELAWRGLRWSDLRRLNKDTRLAKTLSRELDGVTYTLPPNDPRYTFPLPDIEITSGNLTQNPR